jgi:uncharacterized protein YjiS (DUF1127 family)
MFKSLSTLFGAFRAWQRRQSAYNELMALDDRSLADIGLSRSQISFVLKNKVDREDVVVGNDLGAFAPANSNYSRAA